MRYAGCTYTIRGMLVLSLFDVNTSSTSSSNDNSSSSSTQHSTASTTHDAATTVQQQPVLQSADNMTQHTQYSSSSNSMRAVLVRLWHSAQSRLVKVMLTIYVMTAMYTPLYAACMVCKRFYTRNMQTYVHG
jgi:hypothetical protein